MSLTPAITRINWNFYTTNQSVTISSRKSVLGLEMVEKRFGVRNGREANKSCWSLKEMKMSKGLRFTTWSRLRLWINKTTINILVKSFSTFMKSFRQTVMNQCSLQNFLDSCEYIHGSSRCNGNIISTEKILLRSSK